MCSQNKLVLFVQSNMVIALYQVMSMGIHFSIGLMSLSARPSVSSLYAHAESIRNLNPMSAPTSSLSRTREYPFCICIIGMRARPNAPVQCPINSPCEPRIINDRVMLCHRSRPECQTPVLTPEPARRPRFTPGRPWSQPKTSLYKCAAGVSKTLGNPGCAV